MNIFVLGRGNVGGGLARRWERAGHAVTAVGRDGGHFTAMEEPELLAEDLRGFFRELR